jgi:hypothetical protein
MRISCSSSRVTPLLSAPRVGLEFVRLSERGDHAKVQDGARAPVEARTVPDFVPAPRRRDFLHRPAEGIGMTQRLVHIAVAQHFAPGFEPVGKAVGKRASRSTGGHRTSFRSCGHSFHKDDIDNRRPLALGARGGVFGRLETGNRTLHRVEFDDRDAIGPISFEDVIGEGHAPADVRHIGRTPQARAPYSERIARDR